MTDKQIAQIIEMRERGELIIPRSESTLTAIQSTWIV